MKTAALLAGAVAAVFFAIMATLRFVPGADRLVGGGGWDTYADGHCEYVPSAPVALSWRIFGAPGAAKHEPPPLPPPPPPKQPGYPLRGQVVDEQGAPIANARVYANGCGAWRPSDADGGFSFEDCRAGRVSLQLVAAEREGDAMRFDGLEVVVPYRGEPPVITAKRSGARARVHLPQGGRPGAWCRLSRGEAVGALAVDAAWKDNSGTFLFVALEPGPWFAYFHRWDEPSETLHRVAFEAKADQELALDLPADAPLFTFPKQR